MVELQIHAELKAWIDPLSPEEYAQLEANILTEGCRDPIVVWNGFILDGHNRYEICTRHDIDFASVEKAGLVTREDALVWMAQNQLGRRNLSDFTRAALALQLKPLIEQRAQQRMLAGRASDADPTQKSAEGSGETREAIAKAAGVSRDTVRKVEKILESGNAEVAAQVRAGEISINAAAKKVTPPRAPTAAAATLPSISPADTPAAAPAPAAAVAALEPAETEPNGEGPVLDAEPSPQPDIPSVPFSEVEQLREQIAELSESLRTTLADNEMMGRVFDADDRIKAAMAEATRQRAIAENAERTLAAKSGEFVERARAVTHWKNRAEKAEKALAKLKVSA